jgi:Flp pilus assembly protein TadB
MILRNVVIAFSVAACVYALLGWVSTRNRLRTMTAIERANAQIAEAKRKEAQPKLKERFRRALLERGYKGDLTPVLAGMTFMYLICAVGFRILGINTVIGAILAVPATGAIALVIAQQAVVRRRRKFNVQLLQALTLLAAQVEAGNGAQRAIETIIPSLQDPIRSELAATMDATVASKNLVGAMQDLEARYPSRAFRMFIAALEIDQAKGGRLEPALRQAAATLQRDQDLSKEAVAELSQQKGEFFAIVAIISGVITMMVLGNRAASLNAYLSPIGLVISTVALANAGYGVYRGFKIFGKVKGEL